MEGVGAYSASRASALSGVPKSTIHWWARHEILVPTVSPTKVMLWSYSDLMALRVIYWLRRKKTDSFGVDIPSTGMDAIRRALKGLAEAELPLWNGGRSNLYVDGDGHLYFEGKGGLQNLQGQLARGELLDLVAPFSTKEGLHGPDLVAPKPDLRIIPGKLSGSPHVVDTRVETTALAALASDGFDADGIVRLYPFLTPSQVSQALDLEIQLAANLAMKAAA